MFSRGYKRYVLAVVSAIYMLNLVDRGLVVLLLQPIKEDLHLSDTQLGLLTGIAFGLFYAVAGIPIARLADRGNRVTIASIAIGLWGLTVMGCLLVSSYLQLMFARIAAAVGESGCKPPTYSLVGDYFPQPVERTRAMGIYWLGSPLAVLVSFIAGGWLNELYGWRMTFFVMGIPGLILAVLARLTVVEPRTLPGRAHVEAKPLPSIVAVLTHLWRQPSLRHLSLGLILLYTIAGGPWYGAFMMRNHGMGTEELGVWLGLIFGLSGIVGVLSGGFMASHWFAGDERGQMRMVAATVAALMPCFVAFLTLPHKYQALMALAPLMVAVNFCFAPTYALLQRLVPNEMRATTLAVVMLLVSAVGMGVGPLVVGAVSDMLQPIVGNDALRYAMLTMSFVALWAGYHFWSVGRTVREDLSKVGA